MGDAPSLTDMVKLAAIRRVSLTEAVKGSIDGAIEHGADDSEVPHFAGRRSDRQFDDARGTARASAAPAPGASARPATQGPPRAQVSTAAIADPMPAPWPAPDPALSPRLRRMAAGFGALLLAGGARLVAIAILAVVLNVAATSGTGSDLSMRATTQPRRVALVVGNSAYRHTPRLANPKNDAADVSAVLRRLGWHVVEGFDLDKAAFDKAIREFSAALQGADASLFYYAGHGLQVSGTNYLVPVDARLTTAAALDFEMVSLESVQRTMDRRARTTLLFFDACRDNPLARNLAQAMGSTRSAEIGHGLAAVGGGVGTLISFSTQPGNVALDGKGRNSPFTGALVKHLAASNDDLSAVLIAVRNDVVKATGDKQVPWEHSALTARFFFNPGKPTPVATAGPHLKLSEAAEAWGATRDVASIAVLDAFARRFTGTFYAELARARIEDLQRQDAPH